MKFFASKIALPASALFSGTVTETALRAGIRRVAEDWTSNVPMTGSV